MKSQKEKISRKKFLQVVGSAVAGGSIVGVSGVLLHKNSMRSKENTNAPANVKKMTSPYKLVSSFSVPKHIEAFELLGKELIVAASGNIFIYNQHGTLLNNFTIKNNLRDIGVSNARIYLLFPSHIEVYDINGNQLHAWEACSELSDYCSIAVDNDFVFVTDVASKNICKYTTDGNFKKFIQSPNGFVIPSYSFGITCANGTVYCSNSGRHQVESYSFDGEYLGSFGKAGGAAGMFCGCCNPVHLAYTSAGEIITSEKGNPRVSCYSADGKFRSLLLNSQDLGGGNTAYNIKISKNKLFAAGKNMISTFQYNMSPATKTACSNCDADCPLRKGITI
ncbi:MAG: hypothetical protein LBV41_13360 [Cytophagaceae bacterium]|jgi:hypothetical protein|nr:hypothetical protein [Cytophagaceae bacterium]